MKSLQLTKPHLIVMIGLPGAGKSAFAEKFAHMFSAPYINYVALQQMAQKDDQVEKFANYVLLQLMLTRQLVVIDGPGDRQADRREIINFARKHGYTPLFIWVQTEPATTESRSVHSRTSTMTQSQYDARVTEFQNPGKGEPVLVISGKHAYLSQARSVLKRLAQDNPAISKPETSSTPHDRGRIIG